MDGWDVAPILQDFSTETRFPGGMPSTALSIPFISTYFYDKRIRSSVSIRWNNFSRMGQSESSIHIFPRGGGGPGNPI